jgi:5-methylcytosine-specific restriction enzyme subunit McrC
VVTKRHKPLTLYEHQSIRVGQVVAGVEFERKHLDALESFYGTGVPYFSLIHNGVKFNEYVGVIHVGTLTIEVLPKADHGHDSEKWRGILLGILRVVGVFEIHAPSSATLKLKTNSILDLYLELLIIEVEGLLHRGLVKRYRKEENNLTTLKGCLQFSTHIRRNIVHRERFYVRHTVYDQDHQLNQVLYKAIQLARTVNTNPVLSSRIGALLLNFPEVRDCRITDEQFDKIVFDRKTEPYRKAIGIARLLLLHYHPDVVKGTENVLAITFDMNILWERFVYRSLQKFKDLGRTIEAQCSKDFWKPNRGAKVRMRPDIVINRNQEDCVVLDTKWKNLNGFNPSPDDLRQMFVYASYYGANKACLIYPGSVESIARGMYYDRDGKLGDQLCEVVTLCVERDIRQWQKNIADTLIGRLHN